MLKDRAVFTLMTLLPLRYVKLSFTRDFAPLVISAIFLMISLPKELLRVFISFVADARMILVVMLTLV